MDITPSPVCVLNTVSSIPDVIISKGVQNEIGSVTSSEELLYLISLEQANGTTELVQVTKEQARALGIHVYSSTESSGFETVQRIKKKTEKSIDTLNNDISKSICTQVTNTKPLGSCENPIEIIKDGEMLHSTQNISADYLQQIAKALIDSGPETNQKSIVNEIDDAENNIIYRVVYPDELDLKPSQTKRGRPKKRTKDAKRVEKETKVKADEELKPLQNVRTRSGRITRPPRHIRKDFSKIETSEPDNNDGEIKVVEFEPLTTNEPTIDTSKPEEIVTPTNQKRKRQIPSQYRCPKCQKAYIGHSRMLKHIQKHPDHGPMPQRSKLEENDTWNYLIDISNTNPVGQRGLKFCKQLLTLVHNVQIVAKILFKRSSGTEKNLYFINSLLSKVLGIESGNYIINENELRKDVNVLPFLTGEAANLNNVNNEQPSKFDLHAYVEKNPLDNDDRNESKRLKQNDDALNKNSNSNNFNCTLEEINKNSCHNGLNFVGQSSNVNLEDTSTKLENLTFHQEFSQNITSNFANIEQQNKEANSAVDIVSSCNNQQSGLRNNNNEYSLQNDLLSDNSLLNSLPALRTSVEDLILSNVDNTQVTSLLENSTSSDEVMNVDQFVNERFNNFTEPEIELPNPSLSLDLPSLDLFQFHSS